MRWNYNEKLHWNDNVKWIYIVATTVFKDNEKFNAGIFIINKKGSTLPPPPSLGKSYFFSLKNKHFYIQ